VTDGRTGDGAAPALDERSAEESRRRNKMYRRTGGNNDTKRARNVDGFTNGA